MTLLILGGTGEAKILADALAGSGRSVVMSLAGATRSPKPLPLPTRVGGFGGRDGFVAYLNEAGITAVLDATHPFADKITERTAEVCAEKSIPYMQLLRPPWQPVTGDDWTMIAKEEDAVRHIRLGKTVFLGTGRQTLERFKNLEGCRVICRQIDPPTAPFPFEGGEFLIGRPPFPVDREEALLEALGVDVMVVKNAGGLASATKLTAARKLGIPVLMIDRPAPVDAPKVETVEAALAWIDAL